jgi:hypothetical protein
MNKNSFVRALTSILQKFAGCNPDVVANLTSRDGELHLSIIPTAKMRQKWAEKMLDEMHNNYPRSEVALSDPNRKIVVLSISDDCIFNDTAVALCSPQDEFDATIGVAVAYAKWAGHPIPDYI